MSVAEALRSAAVELIGALDGSQRALVHRPFEPAGERQRWFYTPTDHGGLLLSEMTTRQHQTVHGLIGAGLSEGGFNTAIAVMALESILDHVERWPGRPHMRVRDPLRYQVSIFGDPDDDTWGWRVGGHHLSLNFTIVKDAVAATPCFMGADPSTAPLLGDDVYAPLASAEALARQIVDGMTEDQRRTTIVAPHPPWDLVIGNRPQPEPGSDPRKLYEIFRDDPDAMRPLVGGMQREMEEKLEVGDDDLAAIRFTDEPKGVAVAGLSDDQRANVERLVKHYVGRLADDIAGPMLEESPMSSLHLMWAGPTRSGGSHYYRIHGPALLLEYVNVVRERGHIHAVLRDPRGDFGIRLLD